MTKIIVQDERVFPTLGITAQPGDVVDVPDEAFPVVPESTDVVDSVVPESTDVVDLAPKSSKKDVSNGSAPQ